MPLHVHETHDYKLRHFTSALMALLGCFIRFLFFIFLGECVVRRRTFSWARTTLKRDGRHYPCNERRHFDTLALHGTFDPCDLTWLCFPDTHTHFGYVLRYIYRYIVCQGVKSEAIESGTSTSINGISISIGTPSVERHNILVIGFRLISLLILIRNGAESVCLWIPNANYVFAHRSEKAHSHIDEMNNIDMHANCELPASTISPHIKRLLIHITQRYYNYICNANHKCVDSSVVLWFCACRLRVCVLNIASRCWCSFMKYSDFDFR